MGVPLSFSMVCMSLMLAGVIAGNPLALLFEEFIKLIAASFACVISTT